MNLFCPVCGPPYKPYHLFNGNYECHKCKWKGRQENMWQPHRIFRKNPNEQWINEQRSTKLKQILE